MLTLPYHAHAPGPVCQINAHDQTRDAKDVALAQAEKQQDSKQSGCVTFDDEVTMEDTWWVNCSCIHVCISLIRLYCCVTSDDEVTIEDTW